MEVFSYVYYLQILRFYLVRQKKDHVHSKITTTRDAVSLNWNDTMQK